VNLTDFETNLSTMVAQCRRHDIVPVLLTAPTSFERGREPEYLLQRHVENLEELIPLHQSYVEAVRRVAAKEGAVLCDLARAFAKLPREQVQNLHFRDDGIHLRKPGDAKVAELLFACFEEADLFDRILR
jgi:hypothetical protein